MLFRSEMATVAAAVEEAAEVVERTLQRLESLRLRRGAAITGSGSATGMAARRAMPWWLEAPRGMWGLARAERATERTTRVFEKNMARERATAVKGRVGKDWVGLLEGGRERAYIWGRL